MRAKWLYSLKVAKLLQCQSSEEMKQFSAQVDCDINTNSMSLVLQS